MIHLPAEPKKILIVKPSALGDIVHTLPVLGLLRKRFPAAHIDWLVVPAFASLLEGHPQLNGVIPFDRKGYATWWHRPKVARQLLSFALRLRREKYDLAIDFQGLLRSAWITWQTRAPVRVGFAYAREGAPLAYTHKVRQTTPERHAVERYLDIAEALGCGRGPAAAEFGITGAVRESVRQLLGGAERYAVLLPGTNWPTKRWPLESFAALIDPIQQELGLRVVHAGGANEKDWPMPGALSLAGRTDVKQLVALIEGASLVVANDSGGMHIAAALNRPLITLFGPTNPVRTGPYGRPETVLQLDLVCRPCYSRECAHQSCLRWITVDDVMRRARSMVKPGGSLRGTGVPPVSS